MEVDGTPSTVSLFHFYQDWLNRGALSTLGDCSDTSNLPLDTCVLASTWRHQKELSLEAIEEQFQVAPSKQILQPADEPRDPAVI